MPAPWTSVTAWELGISGKIDVTNMLDEKVAAVLEQMKPRLEAHKVLLTCWDD